MTRPELNRQNIIRGSVVAGMVLLILIALTHSGAEPVEVVNPATRTVHDDIAEDAKPRLGDA